MGDAHRRPALEDVLAVGVGGRRQDRDARSRPPGRRQQARRRTRPSREGTHRRRRAPRVRAWRESLSASCEACAGCDTADVTATPALDPRRDDHRVRRGLPRRDDRQRRPARASAQDLPASAGRRPRGPDLRRQRLPRGPRRPAHPRRRACPTTTAGGASTRSAWPGSPVTSALCGLAPDDGVAGPVPAPPGRGRRAARARARSPSSPTRFEGAGARPGVRDLGRGDVGADRCSGRSSAASSSTPIGWRVAFLINVPVLAVALWATLRHVAESRDTRGERPVRLARRARRGARRRRAVVRAHPRRRSRRGRTRSRGSRIVVGVVALIAFPILMARRPDPLVPARACSGRGRSRRSTSRRSSSTAPCTSTFSYQGARPPGRPRLHGARRPGAIGLPIGIMLTLLSTRVGTVAGRIGAATRSSSSGPLLMAAGLLWYARLPADSAPWLATISTTRRR